MIRFARAPKGLILFVLAGILLGADGPGSADSAEDGLGRVQGHSLITQVPQTDGYESEGNPLAETPRAARPGNREGMDLGRTKEEVDSAMYVAEIAAGNPPKLAIGTVGEATESVPASRCWIDYADGYGSGNQDASVEEVTLTRKKTGVSGLNGDSAVADVVWYHHSDRIDFERATYTFRYTDSEISGLNESELTLFKAKNPDGGPWIRVKEQTLDTARNEITGRLDQYGCSQTYGSPGWYFAIVADSTWKEFFPGTKGSLSLLDADVTFLAEEDAGGLGASMAIIGDLDGDGKDDAIISAPLAEVDGKEDVGKVYVILGADAESGWDFDPADAAAWFVGENAEDLAGSSVAAAGDVNGDGVPDFLIGAPWHDQDQLEDRGKTYLIFGDADPATAWGSDYSLSNADASFLGEAAGDLSGYSLAGAGNVGGDQKDDILIGAPGYDNGANEDAGKVYLILGKSSGWAKDVELDDSSVDASFLGKNGGDKFGACVAGVGDVDAGADGYDDLAVGCPGHGDEVEEVPDIGKVYLVLGRETWSEGGQIEGGTLTDWCGFVGTYSDEGFGTVIAGIGNFDGDQNGYADFAISAPRHSDWDLVEVGKTHIVYGMASNDPDWWGTEFNAEDLVQAGLGLHLLGENSYDQSGHSVAGVGDVNNDGYDDMAIGAPLYNNGKCISAGKVYLVFGGANVIPDLGKAPSFVGDCGLSDAGTCVAGRGDMNGDGYADILIGEPFASGPSGVLARTFRIDGAKFTHLSEKPRLPVERGE